MNYSNIDIHINDIQKSIMEVLKLVHKEYAGKFTDEKSVHVEDLTNILDNTYELLLQAKYINYKLSGYTSMENNMTINHDISQKKFTGYYDSNHCPIYVGDTVKEACNGLIRKVVENHLCVGGYGLEGCCPDYNIEDADIEWTKCEEIEECVEKHDSDYDRD